MPTYQIRFDVTLPQTVTVEAASEVDAWDQARRQAEEEFGGEAIVSDDYDDLEEVERA